MLSSKDGAAEKGPDRSRPRDRTSGRLRPVLSSLATLAFAGLVLLAMPPAGLGVSKDGIEVIRYEGSVVGDREAGVVFRVEKRRDQYFRVVRFNGKNIEAHCVDGSSFHSDIGPSGPVLFNKRRTFHKEFRSENPDLGTRGSWEIWGRLVGRNQARGWTRDFTDQPDPGPNETNPAVDCDSGKIRWRAARVD